MELWVRSQDKEILSMCKHLRVGGTYGNEIIGDNDCYLGKYKSKWRALEILDEIQKLLQPLITYEPIVREEYKPSDEYKHFIKVEDNIKIEELSTFVYEMPEK